DELEGLSARPRRVGEQVVPAQLDEPPELWVDGQCVTRGNEEAAAQLIVDQAQRPGPVLPAAGAPESRSRDVRRENGDRRREGAERLGREHAQRVGLLAGSACGGPYPHGRG